MNIKCTTCDNGTLQKQTQKGTVVFEGVELSVPSLRTMVCDNCAAKSYGLRELKKLSKLKVDFIQKANHILGVKEMKALRERLGFSVSEFAMLLGVTRQTVYGWEDSKKHPIKHGPAALLICLLGERDDLRPQILQFLINKAKMRGQLASKASAGIATSSKAKPATSEMRRERYASSAFFVKPTKELVSA